MAAAVAAATVTGLATVAASGEALAGANGAGRRPAAAAIQRSSTPRSAVVRGTSLCRDEPETGWRALIVVRNDAADPAERIASSSVAMFESVRLRSNCPPTPARWKRGAWAVGPPWQAPAAHLLRISGCTCRVKSATSPGGRSVAAALPVMSAVEGSAASRAAATWQARRRAARLGALAAAGGAIAAEGGVIEAHPGGDAAWLPAGAGG